jgi:hypothetical protein
MSKRHFSILLALVIAAALAVALFVPQEVGHENGAEPGLLLPDVGERINQVDEIRVSDGDTGVVTLRRADERWGIAELQAYPADWGKVRQLLAGLAQASIVELKTENPEYYDRLGVQDPSADQPGGLRVEFASGERQWAVIVGNEAGGRDGQYVRLADQPRSLLIDRVLEVTAEPVESAERSITDIASAEVAEVEIIHPDGSWVLARKASPAATDFTLESLPEGREIVSSWTVNSLGGALSSLELDAVELAADQAPEETVRFRLLTFAGMEYMAQAWEADDAHWITIRASVPVEASGEGEGGGPESPEANGAAGNIAAAERFNARVEGWVYRIPEYKYANLSKRLDQLLQPLEDDQPAGDS